MESNQTGAVRPDEFWKPWLSAESGFCRALVGCGYLSEAQMLEAVERYHLGRSRDGGVVFWQVDEHGRTLDGKVMYYRSDCHRDKGRHPTWASSLMKRHYAFPGDITPMHCLFGLHQILNGKDTVAVVESEKTAVILSGHFPEYLWMASGGLSMLSVERLLPLRDRRIVLFPDTDPDGTAFSRWKGIACEASRLMIRPVYVSTLLEEHATAEQKARKINLADYIFEQTQSIQQTKSDL